MVILQNSENNWQWMQWNPKINRFLWTRVSRHYSIYDEIPRNSLLLCSATQDEKQDFQIEGADESPHKMSGLCWEPFWSWHLTLFSTGSLKTFFKLYLALFVRFYNFFRGGGGGDKVRLACFLWLDSKYANFENVYQILLTVTLINIHNNAYVFFLFLQNWLTLLQNAWSLF